MKFYHINIHNLKLYYTYYEILYWDLMHKYAYEIFYNIKNETQERVLIEYMKKINIKYELKEKI